MATRRRVHGSSSSPELSNVEIESVKLSLAENFANSV
jgi:hypothetical protein